MPNKNSLQELITIFSSKTHYPKSFSEQFLRQFFSLIEETLLQDNYIKIKGLGTFKMIEVGERESVDINTGKRIEISAHQRISFSPDKELSKRINAPFENFSSVVVAEKENDQPIETKSFLVQTENVEQTNNVEMSLVEVHSIYLGDDEEKNRPIQEDAVIESAPQTLISEETETDLNDNAKEQESAELEEVQNEFLETENGQDTNEMPDYTDNEELDNEKRNLLPLLMKILFVLALIVGAYFLGHSRLLDNYFCKTGTTSLETAVVSQKKTSPSLPDSLPTPAQAAKDNSVSEYEQLQAESVKYDQMPNGAYWIVGVLETHTMKRGENLTKLALQKYGSKDLCRYVIFFNKISNPDNIPYDAVIQFPKLLPKDSTLPIPAPKENN